MFLVRETTLIARSQGYVMWEELRFLKHSNHWKWALNMIFKGSGFFLFPEAIVTSTAKKSLHSTECGSLQLLTVL